MIGIGPSSDDIVQVFCYSGRPAECGSAVNALTGVVLEVVEIRLILPLVQGLVGAEDEGIFHLRGYFGHPKFHHSWNSTEIYKN